MSSIGPPPDELGAPFYAWLREATESAWRDVPKRELADYQAYGVGGKHWIRGTRWTGGLSDAELELVEARFGLRFPPDHRLFLQMLHATEPTMGGARYVDRQRMESVEGPGFYHWVRDEAAIRAALANVVDGLVFDVEHNALWRDSWGARPDDEAGRQARVEDLVNRAPRLLPILGHRHVLAEGPTVVLSVHQSDIIVYGADLREYLLNDLATLVGRPSLPTISDVETASIPFWGELIE